METRRPLNQVLSTFFPSPLTVLLTFISDHAGGGCREVDDAKAGELPPDPVSVWIWVFGMAKSVWLCPCSVLSLADLDCNDSLKLVEAIAKKIEEIASSNVDEVPGIKTNLQHLIANERTMKKEIYTECEVNLLVESGLGDPRTNSTYEAKIGEIYLTCMNNLRILKAKAAKDQVADLEPLIRNHENIVKKVKDLVLKFIQDQQSDSAEETQNADADLQCEKNLVEEIPDQLEQEKSEPFDDEDAVKDLDDECTTIHHMMKLENGTVISNSKGDGVLIESYFYFLKIGKELHFKDEIVYLAMLTVHKFLAMRMINKKRLDILLYGCLSLAVKVYKRTYNEVEKLLKHFKPKGIDGETLGRMEWSIMSAFQWNIPVVTPFDFTKFFLPRLCTHYSVAESRKDAIRIKSDKIILNVVREGSLLKYRSSEIAAAATLLALDDTCTKEAFGALPVLGLFEIADLFKCYTELRDLDISGMP